MSYRDLKYFEFDKKIYLINPMLVSLVFQTDEIVSFVTTNGTVEIKFLNSEKAKEFINYFYLRRDL